MLLNPQHIPMPRIYLLSRLEFIHQEPTLTLRNARRNFSQAMGDTPGELAESALKEGIRISHDDIITTYAGPYDADDVGSMHMPVSGKVISRFRREYNKQKIR